MPKSRQAVRTKHARRDFIAIDFQYHLKRTGWPALDIGSLDFQKAEEKITRLYFRRSGQNIISSALIRGALMRSPVRTLGLRSPAQVTKKLAQERAFW
jgi:hypothetical protein